MAVALANPSPAVAGQVIQLDATTSYHTDPAKTIVSYEWDLDNNGSFETPGPFAAVSFGTVGTYPVTLKVIDSGSGGSVQTDEDVILIQVTTPPVAPTADANGPYVFLPRGSQVVPGRHGQRQSR